MKQTLINIIDQAPKRYSQIIKNNNELANWVDQNSLIESDRYCDKIYSAVSQTSNTCPNGQIKKLKSFSQGWAFCGHSKTCACNAQNSKEKVSKTKSDYSQETIDSINQKRQCSMIEKYGVAYNSQRSDIHHIWQSPKVSSEIANILSDPQWMRSQYIDQKRSLVDIADELGVYYSTVGEYCRQHGFEIRQRSNYSLEESQISNFLKSIGIDHQLGDWDQLDKKELDVWIPQHNIAIELNGLYWHSYHPGQNKPEDRLKHLQKTIECEQKGIELIHITDSEWHNQNLIIKNILKSKLKLNKTVGARTCNIAEISNTEANHWFKQHHLQGNCPAHRSFALTKNKEILLAVSIGKSRFNKHFDYELIRMCGSPDITVSGGLSRIMQHIKNQLNGAEILTYCDRSKSTARGYQAAGFELVRSTEPGYFWTDGTDIISRYRCQKNQLKNWLPNYDPSLSESANMFTHKYRRFWDCGNWVLKF